MPNKNPLIYTNNQFQDILCSYAKVVYQSSPKVIRDLLLPGLNRACLENAEFTDNGPPPPNDWTDALPLGRKKWTIPDVLKILEDPWFAWDMLGECNINSNLLKDIFDDDSFNLDSKLINPVVNTQGFNSEQTDFIKGIGGVYHYYFARTYYIDLCYGTKKYTEIYGTPDCDNKDIVENGLIKGSVLLDAWQNKPNFKPQIDPAQFIKSLTGLVCDDFFKWSNTIFWWKNPKSWSGSWIDDISMQTSLSINSNSTQIKSINIGESKLIKNIDNEIFAGYRISVNDLYKNIIYPDSDALANLFGLIAKKGPLSVQDIPVPFNLECFIESCDPTPTPTPTTSPQPPTPTPSLTICNDPYYCTSVNHLTEGTSVYGCQPVIYGEQTVNIPAGLSPPVYVTLIGGADDQLVIDGQIVVTSGQYLSYSWCPCPTGCYINADNYSFILNSSSFTIAGGDTIGGNCGYTYDICFYQMGISNEDCLPPPTPTPSNTPEPTPTPSNTPEPMPTPTGTGSLSCCCVNGITTSMDDESLCLSLGGTFYADQSCGSVSCPPVGVCGCTMFFDSLKLLVVDSGNNVMVDRTTEALDSLRINSSNHDMIDSGASCNTPSCSGNNLGYHYQCQIFTRDPNNAVIYCDNDCSCDKSYINIPEGTGWIRPLPSPGPGYTAPGSEDAIYDPNGEWFNSSVNITPFPSFYSLTWKPGYPEAFNGAPYVIWRNFLGLYSGSFVNTDCTEDCGCIGPCEQSINPETEEIIYSCPPPCVCVSGVCVDSRTL